VAAGSVAGIVLTSRTVAGVERGVLERRGALFGGDDSGAFGTFVGVRVAGDGLSGGGGGRGAWRGVSGGGRGTDGGELARDVFSGEGGRSDDRSAVEAGDALE